MIHTIYFMSFSCRRNYAEFGKSPIYQNDYETLKFLLEETNSVFTAILTKSQTSIRNCITQYELDSFIEYESNYIVNPNYPDHGPKLKLLIFRGKGEIDEHEIHSWV